MKSEPRSEVDKVVTAVIDTVLKRVEIQRPGILVDGESFLSGEHYEEAKMDVTVQIEANLDRNIKLMVHEYRRLRGKFNDLSDRYTKMCTQEYLHGRRR